jgi:hypothetical protein
MGPLMMGRFESGTFQELNLLCVHRSRYFMGTRTDHLRVALSSFLYTILTNRKREALAMVGQLGWALLAHVDTHCQ